MTTPVSPGDPIFPKMTAQWFNSTVKRKERGRRANRSLSLPREGMLYCLALDSTAAQYEAVTILGLNDTTQASPIVPKVQSTGQGHWNWGVVQQGMTSGGTVLVCLAGITKAWVYPGDTNCSRVTYRNGRLEQSRYGKGVLLDYGGSSYPSLISIGTMPSCNRVVGTLSSAMAAVATNFGISNLRGIEVPATELGSSITALNIHEFEADSGAVVRAEWVVDPGRWEIYQVSCPA